MSGIIGDNLGRSGGLVKGAATPSAGMTLVHSHNVTSSVSIVTFDNVFTSTYDLYRVYGYEIYHASDAQDGYLLFVDSSGSRVTAGSYERVYWYAGDTGTFSSSANASTSDTKLQINASIGEADASQSMSFVADIFNPQSTSFEKMITCTSFTKGNGNIWLWKAGCTLGIDGTAMRGLEYSGSAYCDGGKFRIYGITNS